MEVPPERLVVQANVENRTATNRQPYSWTMRVPADSGLSIFDPADYYVNMDLRSARELANWILQWCKYQAERFKPTGFRLVNINTNEKHERADGQSIILVGDSFYIRDENGTQVSEALPLTEWEIQPIYPTPTV